MPRLYPLGVGHVNMKSQYHDITIARSCILANIRATTGPCSGLGQHEYFMHVNYQWKFSRSPFSSSISTRDSVERVTYSGNSNPCNFIMNKVCEVQLRF